MIEVPPNHFDDFIVRVIELPKKLESFEEVVHKKKVECMLWNKKWKPFPTVKLGLLWIYH